MVLPFGFYGGHTVNDEAIISLDYTCLVTNLGHDVVVSLIDFPHFAGGFWRGVHRNGQQRGVNYR